MNKPIYRVCSFSGGKDSTAMLLRLLEEGIHIDCILFVDTGLEFPEMYEHIDKVERDIGREITRIRAEHTYEYMMFDIPVKRKAESSLTLRYGSPPTGYGWPGPRQRWCTTRLKDMPREKFLSPLRKKYEVLEYVGITFAKKGSKVNWNILTVKWKWGEETTALIAYDVPSDTPCTELEIQDGWVVINGVKLTKQRLAEKCIKRIREFIEGTVIEDGEDIPIVLTPNSVKSGKQA